MCPFNVHCVYVLYWIQDAQLCADIFRHVTDIFSKCTGWDVNIVDLLIGCSINCSWLSVVAKWCVVWLELTLSTKGNPYTTYWMAQLWMTFSDLCPAFHGHAMEMNWPVMYCCAFCHITTAFSNGVSECKRVLGAACASQWGPGEQWAGCQTAAVRRPSHVRQLQHQDSPTAAGSLQPRSSTISWLPHRHQVRHGPSHSCPPGLLFITFSDLFSRVLCSSLGIRRLTDSVYFRLLY